MRTLALICLIALCQLPMAAQKLELLEDKDVILARAKAELEAALLPGTALHAAVIEEKLIGRYVIQVSFREKGDVSSVFVVSAEEADIRSQNRFKDLLHAFRFGFKMPKGRQYRIEMPFDLNAIPR